MSEFLQIAFDEVLEQERIISQTKMALVEATTPLEIKLRQAETKMGQAWRQIELIMAETGEYEVLVPGEACDYKIAWSKPRQRVKVDEDAVPDEYCRIERKPKLREIGEMLESGAQVNWARFENGDRKLNWKAIKKGKSNAA